MSEQERRSSPVCSSCMCPPREPAIRSTGLPLTGLAKRIALAAPRSVGRRGVWRPSSCNVGGGLWSEATRWAYRPGLRLLRGTCRSADYEIGGTITGGGGGHGFSWFGTGEEAH